MLTVLTTESNWNEFANGVDEATATGAPTAEMLMLSYNSKYNTELNYTNRPTLDITDKLYVPKTEEIDACLGYWLSEYPTKIWYVHHSGLVSGNCAGGSSYVAARPVVCLPSSATGTIGETVEIDK